MDRAIPSPVARTIQPPKLAPVPPFQLKDVSKRALDICGSLAGLLLLLPLFTIVAVRIRRHSPGPVFYRATRTGKDGKQFDMLKFRTMEQWHDPRRLAKVTAEDDPRVTPFGRRLRDAKINELPQLWNVLKGDMSLVGPRPEDPDIVASWSEEVRREVLSVKPGITSPASVLYRDEEALLSSQNWMQTYLKSILPTKLRLDQLYVRRRSFWLDLDVLCWTVLIVLPGVRSLIPQEDGLFFGPLARLGRRYLNWFTIDMLVTFLAVGVVGLVWRNFEVLNVGLPYALLVAGGFALLFSLMGWVLGVNRIAWSRALPGDALPIFVSATFAGAAALAVNQVLGPRLMLPPGMVVSASTVAFGGFIGLRYRRRLYKMLAASRGREAIRERVLIIGSGSTGEFVAWLLGNSPSAGGFRVVGYVDDDVSKQGVRFGGIKVVGRCADIGRLVERYDIGVLIFAIHNVGPQERQALIRHCSGSAARLVIVPDIASSLAAVIAERAAAKEGPSETLPPPPAEVPLPVARGISPVQAEMWLSDLEEMAQAGDLAGLGDRIRAIREGILAFGGGPAE